MYEIFYLYADGRREWLSHAETERRAKTIATIFSKRQATPVMVVLNCENGHTKLLYELVSGIQRSLSAVE